MEYIKNTQSMEESARYDLLVDEIDREALKKGVPSELLYYWYD